MTRAIASAMLVSSVCLWTVSRAADMEIGKVYQSHAPGGQAYLVVSCPRIDECFEDAYQYCKGPYQALDKYPSPGGFRFECGLKDARDVDSIIGLGGGIQPGGGIQGEPTIRTQILVGKGFPNTEDYYPKDSRKQGEQGMTVVKVCVSSTGRLTEPPTVDQTSGFARLDAAAIKYATAGDGHYVPATSDGQPVAACSKIGVRFAAR